MKMKDLILSDPDAEAPDWLVQALTHSQVTHPQPKSVPAPPPRPRTEPGEVTFVLEFSPTYELINKRITEIVGVRKPPSPEGFPAGVAPWHAELVEITSYPYLREDGVVCVTCDLLEEYSPPITRLEVPAADLKYLEFEWPPRPFYEVGTRLVIEYDNNAGAGSATVVEKKVDEYTNRMKVLFSGKADRIAWLKRIGRDDRWFDYTNRLWATVSEECVCG